MIRLATTHDAEGVHAIYAPIVRNTAISFEWDVPTVADIEARIQTVLSRRPWLVYERNTEVLGYVYASNFRDRLSYQWGAEVTVYIRADARGRGLARGLYTALFEVLKLQGFCTVVAGATLPNAATERLHESMGFRQIGIYPAAGFKLGRWHDVVFWHMALQPAPKVPSALLRPGQIIGTDAWHAALARGQALIRET